MSDARTEEAASFDHLPEGPVLVVGGAGFVGTNLCLALGAAGRRVIVLDSLARPGTEANAATLRDALGPRLDFRLADVRDRDAVEAAVRDAGSVFHFAAQVAVTTSLEDPREDFEVNALGTLNVLEALRAEADAPGGRPKPMLFTSTNKVYGGLEDLDVHLVGDRYRPVAGSREAVGEAALDFHSPYGCSKGAADQYVIDYGRTYRLPTVVFRMSCIYGPHQCGNADQGWVAHFVRAALAGEGVTLYGDGAQVRDTLYVNDLVEAMAAATRALGTDPEAGGRAYNVGGGPGFTLSLRELVAQLREKTGRPLPVTTEDWRPGDQRYYVSDLSAIAEATGWRPRTPPEEGLQRLIDWTRSRLEAGSPKRVRQAVDGAVA